MTSAFHKALGIKPFEDDPQRARPEGASVWLEGKDLVIRFHDSHTVRLDIERERDGAKIWTGIFLDILHERARVPRAVIATSAAPVAYDIEGIYRAIRGARPENFRSKPTKSIEEIGLDDLSFD